MWGMSDGTYFATLLLYYDSGRTQEKRYIQLFRATKSTDAETYVVDFQMSIQRNIEVKHAVTCCLDFSG